MAITTPQSSPAKLPPGASPGGGTPGTPGGMMVPVASVGGGGNIKVVVRCRPLNTRELARGAKSLIRMSNGAQTFLDPPETAGNASTPDSGVLMSGGGPDSPRANGVGGSPAVKGREREKKAHAFSFDHSYWSADKTSPDYASQHTLYTDLGIELLDHSFAGYNTCIFAYGQTGSGKSYSMMGYGQDKGIIPLTTEELFRRIEEKKTTEPQIQYRVEVSYMEIYNEKVRDLLNPKNKGPLKVREHPSLGPYVEDLSRLTVDNNAGLIHLMDEGNVARTVAATKMNETSSRSHAVFTLILTQTRLDETTNLSGEKVSKISLVDLAGSERANSTGATGARLKEGANINKSLTTLGKVIQALAAQSSDTGTRGRRKKDDFVPFRDSVLTWLLKESLGGNSKTCMIAAISPADYEETLSTLRYADQAKQIKTNAVVNEDPTAKLIRSLKEELEELRGRASGKTIDNIEESTFDHNIPPEKQFVTYRTRSGEIKTVSKLELQENLEASEKLMASLNESWEEKMRKTAEIAVERERTLEELGISVDKTLIGVHAPKRNPHLVNLSEDPLMSECLVYQIPEGRTLVGSAEAGKAAIKLSGARVKPEHCVFTNQGKVTLEALDADAITLVNGRPLEPNQPMALESGFRIIIDFHVFRFAFPEAVRAQRIQASTSAQDFAGDRSESPFKTLREDSEESPEPQVLDWTFAKREAALARLNGRGPVFDQLRDEDLDELFNDIVKVRTSRGRPESGGPGMALPHSFSDNDIHRRSRPESVPMSIGPSGDTAGDPWSEVQQSTSITTQANSVPLQDGKDDGEPPSAASLQTLQRSAHISAPSETPSNMHAVEEQSLMEQQVRRVQQEMQNLRQQSARAKAHGGALIGISPLTGPELRLARAVVSRWKNHRSFAMAESTLVHAADIREANVLARQASKAVSYNSTVINRCTPLSILDKGINTLIFDSGIASAMTVSSAPQVGIRVIDHDNLSVYLWDMTRFQQQLRKMRSLRAMQHRPSFSKHFAVDPVFLEVPAPSYTFLGSVLIPLSTLLARQSAYYTLTIFCRDTGEACGTCRTSFDVSPAEPADSRPSTPGLSSLQDGEQLDFAFCVDMVKAFSSEDVSDLHMQIKLSSLAGEVAAEDTFASNLVDLDKTSSIHLKLRKKINIDITSKTLDHFRDQYAVLEFFGRAKETYLHRLERWDERREARVGVSQSSTPLSPSLFRPRMLRHGSESVSESLHTVVSHLRILELDQDGVWAPVEVRTSVTEPSVFQLHQGLQRRLSIHLSHNSARSLDWTGIGCVDLSDVRLVSCKGKSTSHDHQKIVQANRIGSSKITYTSDGQGILSGAFSWDTSSHGTPHLDGRTNAGHHVLLRLTFQVALADTDDPAVFSHDVAVAVLQRDARRSSKLLGYLSGTKLTAQSSSIFSLRLSLPLTRDPASLWQLDTGGKHVDGQELLGEWHPRTPRLVEDFLSLRDIERRQADVQVIKGILRRSELRTNIAVTDRDALLQQCIECWRKTVGEKAKPIFERETPEQASLRRRVGSLLPDFKPRFITTVALQPAITTVARSGWVNVLEDSPNNSWKRQWLVLTRPYLRFYKSSDERLELRVVCLKGCEVTPSPDVERLMETANAFTIFATTNTTILHAATAKEANDWITTLRCQ